MQRIERGLAQFAHLPVLLVWGMKDRVLGEGVLRIWQRVFPRAEACVLEFLAAHS